MSKTARAIPGIVALAIAFAVLLLAENAAAGACRWLRYQLARACRRGNIRAEMSPLSDEHEAIWTRTLRNYDQPGHEPVRSERDDWWSE